jgi:3-hydroxyisobutyrate dehydrogenase-like beta-hydroxyacid dehydrogenase
MSSVSIDRDAAAVVGWIGLGSMGIGMAKNIQKHLAAHGSQQLRVFNRTASRCAPVEELGAKRSDSIPQLAQECDIIFLSVRHYRIL